MTQETILERARAAKAAGRLGEATAQLEEALGSTRGTTRDRVEMIRELVDVHTRAGAWRNAHARIDEALQLLDQQPDEDHNDLHASLLERRARVLFLQGKLQEAAAIARPLATRLSQSGNCASLRGDLHNTLGGIAWNLGDLSTAMDHVRRAAELYADSGNTLGSANARMNLGILHYSQGEWSEAAEELAAADQLRRESGWTPGRATNLRNLGLLHMSMGNLEDARAEIEEALRLGSASGEQHEVASAHVALAQLDLTEDKLDDACRHIDDALGTDECLCDDTRVQAAWMKALIECDRSGSERGVEIAAEARNVARQNGLVESEADCCRALGVAYRRGSHFAEAEQALRESLSLAERVGDSYRRGLALLELAAVSSNGRSHLAEATQVFERLGARHDLSRAQAMA